MLRWFLGRNRRSRRSGLSAILLFIGILSCPITCMMVGFGVPATWMQFREIQALPQPSPAELTTVAPGTRMLSAAQLAPDMPIGPHGLVLFYIEESVPRRATEDDNDATKAQTSSSDWHRYQLPPLQVEMLLDGNEPVIVQLPPTISFLNAQQVEETENTSESNQERILRYTGYLPNQILTIEGTWEGNNIITAQTVYAGRLDDYLDYLANQPGTLFLSGIMCGVMGVFLVGVGLILRMLGK